MDSRTSLGYYLSLGGTVGFPGVLLEFGASEVNEHAFRDSPSDGVLGNLGEGANGVDNEVIGFRVGRGGREPLLLKLCEKFNVQLQVAGHAVGVGLVVPIVAQAHVFALTHSIPG